MTSSVGTTNHQEPEATGTLGPALAVVELSSLARAYRVTDAMMKRAPAHLWRTSMLSSGKFLIVLTGGVAEVEESYEAGLRIADDVVLDRVFLPQVDPQVLARLAQSAPDQKVDALGIIECRTCASAVRGADAAVKMAEVGLVQLHLGQGIGGKGIYAFAGELFNVQAALEASQWAVGKDFLLMSEEIPAPHGDMTLSMLGLPSLSPVY